MKVLIVIYHGEINLKEWCAQQLLRLHEEKYGEKGQIVFLDENVNENRVGINA